MHWLNKSLLLICISLFTILYHSKGQEIYIDSLAHLLAQPSTTLQEKPLLLCKLAKANTEKDLKKSFKQAREAIHIGHKLNTYEGPAIGFATLIYLYIQANDIKQAYESLDSALYYASRTSDPVAKGFVEFRNGWLDLVNGESDKSITKLLKALDLFKTVNFYEYEATIYHYLASIYGYGNDVNKQLAYARLSFESAKKSGQVDALNTAYFTVGHSFYDRFKLDTTKHDLLDSALIYNKRSIRLSTIQRGRLIAQSNTAAAALNIANSYFKHFPNTYKDSADKYIDFAIEIAKRTNLHEVLMNCYGIRSEYALREGRYDEAEKTLLNGLAALEGNVLKMPVTKARIFLALSRIAEKKGSEKTALSYLKQHIAYNQEAFDEEKITNIQKMEARYSMAKKEQEISYLKKRNFLYLIIGLSCILTLLFLLSSYNYKLKASTRKQALIDREKEEAQLKAQLKEAEANRLHTEQVLLKEREERLQKEILAGTLQIEEKNGLLEMLSDKIAEKGHLSVDEQIKRIVQQQKRMDKEFEGHKTDFFESESQFFEKLQEKANHTLTRLDLKYCSYILMGLSNKEISTRLSIEPKSIRMARYRLKQKLGLDKNDQLDQFIQQVGRLT
ncbi:MAG: LuxR C-terminal-related transcriptional regulator [Pseudosphingobacterium sp.]|nr:LuxR C-terminal-related transcriptional regulator [Olivibacter sp. UJ_SKK_5.1]MDX3916565.1 LuxR C-terminal-related transcriptional regulator [Pseudosphingobacterium sp.]